MLREDGALVTYHRDGETHEVELVFDRSASLDLGDVLAEIIEGRMMPGRPSTVPPPPSS
jgi:hypothetical protein